MRLLICTQAVDRTDPILGFFHRWLEEFAKHCEQVVVVCLHKGDYALPPNVKVITLPQAGKIRRAAALCRISFARRKEYDAVFVHMNPEYLVAAGWLWRLLHKRVALWYTHKSVSLYVRVAHFFTEVVFTASTESFRLASRKVRVVGHGIDTTRPVPPRTSAPGLVRLITTGRIAPVKGIEVMVEAFLMLKAQGVNTTFVAYGPTLAPDAAYQEKLSERLRAVGENPADIFPGAVAHDELPLLRSQADYLLHASETGSLDKNVLDAAMSGVVPVSSSEAYGELFAGYEDLLQYPKGGARALAERLVALQALPEEKREEIRRTLRRRVEESHGLASLVPQMLSALTL